MESKDIMLSYTRTIIVLINEINFLLFLLSKVLRRVSKSYQYFSYIINFCWGGGGTIPVTYGPDIIFKLCVALHLFN